MGALESLWRCLSGKPSVVAKSGLGDTRAVKSPPSFDVKFEDGVPPYMTHSTDGIPKYAQKTFKMISRKKGATIDEIHEVVGKKRGSIYNHIYVIRGCGFDVVKGYDKKSGSHRYRLG
jgi:hypothetical protein